MDLVKSAKEIGNEIEKGAELIVEKAGKTFDNIVSHLPFSNLAKKDNSNFYIEVDLPGVTKEDISINIEDGVLSVSAVRSYTNSLNRDDYYICESSYGKLERRFVLPENIDTKRVNASLDDGRLTIELEKTSQAKPKKISIK